MQEKKKIHKSKQLAWLLRHDKKYNFDESGGRSISDLTENHGFSREELTEIVATDPKGRYEFFIHKDVPSIRARWGHSFPVNYGNECKDVPDTLYHGTADIYLPRIQREGLKKMGRQFVHLTNDRLLAMNTGKRHGNPIVLTIDARKMQQDGFEFWKRGDCIWLTEKVEVKYISIKTEIAGE